MIVPTVLVMDHYHASNRFDSQRFFLYDGEFLGCERCYLYITTEQLFHVRANSYFGEIRGKVAKLIKITVQTGFLTSALAITSLVLSLTVSFGLYSIPYVNLFLNIPILKLIIIFLQRVLA